ncbi:MAG: hypothetical protein WDO16_05115 [Bacteroidota bacterium]
MAAAKTTDNPIGNVLEFYINLAEELSPKMKKGIEDWFTFYGKLWEQGIKLQEDWMNQWAGKNSSSSRVAEDVKDLGEKVMASQRKASTDIVDATVQGMKSFRKKTATATKQKKRS